jgi:uncharacterized membrane protein
MATATAPVAVQTASWLRPKYLIFGVVGLMLAYVLVHNESFLFNRADPVWHHYQPFKWYLLPHGLAGACALFLGPLQFSNRLRQRFTKWHRVVGRIYVIGALVAAPMGAYIQYFEERMGATRSFSLAAMVDAVLLMLTTAIAFYFAYRRKIQQHRQWMTRSFAVALVFLEVRVIGGVGGWDGNPAAIETIVWICVAASLLVGDVVLQAQESLRSRPPTMKVAAV